MVFKGRSNPNPEVFWGRVSNVRAVIRRRETGRKGFILWQKSSPPLLKFLFFSFFCFHCKI